MKKNYILFACSLLLAFISQAQKLSSDDYFQMARKAAFEQDNYPEAIRFSRQALDQSPGYTDVAVFLGRVYYWSGHRDSSMSILKTAVENTPASTDAVAAIADIEYFGEHYNNALAYIESGLAYHPGSQELLVRKAKCFVALNQYKQAQTITDSLLQADPKNSTLQSLATRIRQSRARNKFGISYDYTHFSKQFNDPWQIVSIDYGRQTKAGSFIGRINSASRYGKQGTQFEVDAYPRISKTFYAYTNLGFSPDLPVFPKFRAGFSLYANLPKSFEADAGFRYLNFSSDTWIYTFAVGKYYKNFWFNARTYITPSNNELSQSYSVTARYYTGGADDYFSFAIGRGISPDDRSQANLLNNPYQLKTKKMSGAYRFSVRRMNVFSLSAAFENVEYQPKVKGNQLGLSLGYQRKF